MRRDQKAGGSSLFLSILLFLAKLLGTPAAAVAGFLVGVPLSIGLQMTFPGKWVWDQDGPGLCFCLSMIGLFFPWFIGPLSRLVFPLFRELSYSSRRIEEWSRIFGVLYFLASCLVLLFSLTPLTQHQKGKRAARWTGKMGTEWATDQWTDELGTEWATDQWTDKMVAERVREKENASKLADLGAAIERDASGNVVKVNCHLNARITDSDLVHLKGLTRLKALRLSYTWVTDKGLVHLQELTNLQTLYLEDTQVTDAGVAELQKALPNCKITK